MSLIDWMIVLVPLAAVVYFGFIVRGYVKTVADFLTAGRVAGRYLISVSDGVTGLGVITMVSMFEQYYRAGNSLGFWQNIGAPVALLMTLTGFVVYRYRETRAMTLAQFFEMRYSKSFRIFAGALVFASGVLNYSIFPAVSGRFIVYYCRLPLSFELFGLEFSTFGVVMAIFLALALFITLLGGMLTTMVTDCIQGIYSLIVYAILTLAILSMFTTSQFKEAMLARPAGQSMFNPFDTKDMQEFNILFILISIFNMVYARMALQGQQGYNCAGASPHEQKMGSILGTWRSGMTYLMIPLLAFGAYTYLHHPDFAAGAQQVQSEIASRINMDSEAVTRTIREQMTVPITLRNILPVGLVGLFCSLAVFLLVSTDTTYLQSFGSIFIQDVVLPWRKKPFEQKTQLLMLRLAIAGVAVFAWTFSYCFGMVTYITMFFAATSSIFLCGAGSCIIGGLYWKRGTAAGAWSAMLASAGIGIGGFALQKLWPGMLYPYLAEYHPQQLEAFRSGLEGLGNALPFVSWKVTPYRFPLSGREVMMLSSLICISIYVSVSLLTCRKAFNLEKLLHRGRYNLEHRVVDASEAAREEKLAGSSWWRKYFNWRALVGITPEYTRGDRILSWSVLSWSLYNFAVFIMIAVWNLGIRRWTGEEWFRWWRYYDINLGIGVGLVTTVWFTWGGTRDLLRLFRSLKTLDHQAGDDGRVNSDTHQ